jgi:hypothetical protein
MTDQTNEERARHTVLSWLAQELTLVPACDPGKLRGAVIVGSPPNATSRLATTLTALLDAAEARGAEREREACAQIVDRNDKSAWGLARAIRARGEVKP